MIFIQDKELRGRIVKTASPAIIEMVMYMVIGVADIAFVGRLGAAPLAAVSLGSELFFGITLLLAALGTGSAVLAAHAKGAGDTRIINSIMSHSLWLGLIIGIILGYAGYCHHPALLSLFPLEDAVYLPASDYLKYVFAVTPMALMLYMANNVFRGIGRTDIPMKIALVMNIINVVGDYLLVFGIGFFPAMGVKGAAAATAFAHVVSFIIMIVIVFSGRTEIKIAPRLLTKFSWLTFRHILGLGLPTLTENCFQTFNHLISMFLVVYLGTVAFASHQLSLTVESFSFMPGFGIAIAATALVGQSFGGKFYKEAIRTTQGCWEFALMVMGSFALIFALFPQFVASLFTNDPAVILQAGLIIRIAALEQFSLATDMVFAGTFRGLGDTRTPMAISVICSWVFRLPLMFILIKFWPGTGLIHIWILFVLDWSLRAVVFLILWQKKKKQLLLLDSESANDAI